ncbi:MAG: sugar ABC transporter permease, partial [Clostridiales bacterium]|nr:sugar ABC transporter permease [Clostridiales bacterium]
PYLMPSAAIIFIWRIIFDYSGVVNRLVIALGFSKINWLDGMAMRLPVILLYIWKNLGFSVVIFAAALQAVPEALYEFASLEGANAFKREFKITLPLVLPTAFLVFVLAWVNTFKIFKEVYIISGPYPSEEIYTLQHYMNNLFNKLDYQNVTAAAYIFAAMVLVMFSILYAFKAVRSPDQL